MLSNHNEMSILSKRLYYGKHGGLDDDCMHINFIILGLDLFSVKYFLRFSNIGSREKLLYINCVYIRQSISNVKTIIDIHSYVA